MKKGKQVLSLLLVLAMMIGILPAESFRAAEQSARTEQAAFDAKISDQSAGGLLIQSKKLKLKPKKATLTVGESVALKVKGGKAKKVKWTSKDPSVATVDDTGVVYATGEGKTKIIAKVKKKKLKCKITVKPAPLPEIEKTEIETVPVTAEETTATVESSSGEIVVDLMPGLIDEGQNAAVTVSEVEGVPVPEGVEGLKAFDFTLTGAEFSEDDCAEIRIPFELPKGAAPVAGYYNEKTGKNEPLPAVYKDGVLTITTNHFSTYWSGVLPNGAYVWIENPNTTKAYIQTVYGVDLVEQDATESVRVIGDYLEENNAKLAESNLKIAKKLLSDIWGKNWDEYTTKVDDTGDAINYLTALGFDGEDYFNGALGDFGDTATHLSFLNSMVNAIGYAIDGDKTMATATTVNAIGNLSLVYVMKAMGVAGAVSSGVCLAVASIIGNLVNGLNKVVAANEKKWYDAYHNCYNTYKKADGEGRKLHYYEWRDELAPFYMDKTKTGKEAADAIEAYVDSYLGEFWKDEGLMATWLWDNGERLTAGLTDELIDKITTMEKKNLMENEIRIVSEWYMKKARADYLVSAREMAQKQADALNHTIDLGFYDSNAQKEGSSLAGYKVRFKSVPSGIQDKENLEVVLDKNGEGHISFNLWAAENYGIKSEVEIVDPDGKVMNELSFRYGPNENRIDIATEYLELSPTELTLAPGGKGKLYVKGIDIEKVNFSSSDVKIAKIGEKGKDYIEIEAGDFGTATINAEAGDLKASAAVKVEETLIDLNQPEVTLTEVGADTTVYLVKKATAADGSMNMEQLDIDSWTQNSGKKVCEVKKSGKGLKIKALKDGTSEIAVVYDGVTYYCNVTVKLEAVEGYYCLSADSLELEVGETAMLYLLYVEGKKETSVVIPSIENTAAEVVDHQRGSAPEYGIYLTGVSEGIASIIIGDGEGGTYTCEVTVKKAGGKVVNITDDYYYCCSDEYEGYGRVGLNLVGENFWESYYDGVEPKWSLSSNVANEAVLTWDESNNTGCSIYVNKNVGPFELYLDWKGERITFKFNTPRRGYVRTMSQEHVYTFDPKSPNSEHSIITGSDYSEGGEYYPDLVAGHFFLSTTVFTYDLDKNTYTIHDRGKVYPDPYSADWSD